MVKAISADYQRLEEDFDSSIIADVYGDISTDLERQKAHERANHVGQGVSIGQQMRADVHMGGEAR